jgi:hypothetical protein
MPKIVKAALDARPKLCGLPRFLPATNRHRRIVIVHDGRTVPRSTITFGKENEMAWFA